MVKYIFKIRNDSLYLLDVNITDRMLRTAGKMLSRFFRNISEASIIFPLISRGRPLWPALGGQTVRFLP